MLEHLDLNALIAVYGYWVIFLRCMLEGKTVLILSGMAAHQGNLLHRAGAVVATDARAAGRDHEQRVQRHMASNGFAGLHGRGLPGQPVVVY